MISFSASKAGPCLVERRMNRQTAKVSPPPRANSGPTDGKEPVGEHEEDPVCEVDDGG